MSDDFANLSDHDRAEIERFYHYCRQVKQAEQAGCSRTEAIAAVYPDVYPEDDAARARQVADRSGG